VRELGRSLGLPPEIVERQPFPGPGLGIRIICAEEPSIPDEEKFAETWMMLKSLTDYGNADSVFSYHFKNTFSKGDGGKEKFAELEEKLRQIQGINGTLVPIRTVGVQGDERTHSYLAALSGTKNWDDLFFLAKLIPRVGHKINRIAYLFGDKYEPHQIREVTPTFLTPDIIKQLQEADDIVNQELLNYELMRKLSQVPVVSVPIGFGEEGKRSIAIRTFITNDFMTGRPAVPGIDMPEEALDVMTERILAEVPGIARVMFDLTSKPPGTTEWE